MQTVLIVVHLMVVIALVIVVLLQRSEGGALGIGSSSTGGLFTGRGQANALTRATAVLAAIFFATSIALTVIASYGRAQKSIFQPASAPAGEQTPGTPAGGNLLDSLKKMQDQAPAAPAVPTTPEAPRSR
jgi:preprotein translocase subunit SecG